MVLFAKEPQRTLAMEALKQRLPSLSRSGGKYLCFEEPPLQTPTPNPLWLCNTWVKHGVLSEQQLFLSSPATKSDQVYIVRCLGFSEVRALSQ